MGCGQAPLDPAAMVISWFTLALDNPGRTRTVDRRIMRQLPDNPFHSVLAP
jgi:hypothetical protein